MAARLVHALTRLLTLAVVAAAVVGPAIAHAQDVVPQPDLKRAPQPWVGYLVMVTLAALVMGVSLLPSKRGHQD